MTFRRMVEEYRALSGFDAVEVEVNEHGWCVRARKGSHGVAIEGLTYEAMEQQFIAAIDEARVLAAPEQ